MDYIVTDFRKVSVLVSNGKEVAGLLSLGVSDFIKLL